MLLRKDSTCTNCDKDIELVTVPVNELIYIRDIEPDYLVRNHFVWVLKGNWNGFTRYCAYRHTLQTLTIPDTYQRPHEPRLDQEIV